MTSRDSIVMNARANGLPDPEKFADSAIRARERAIAIKEKRPHIILTTTKPPRPSETVVKNGRVSVPAGEKCKATTLAGKQCGFRATRGCFCKKHEVDILS